MDNIEKMETFLGETCSIDGTLNVEHSITISGRFTGSIKAGGKVIISATGIVEADVEAQELVTAGRIKGNVKAVKRTVIHPTGRIDGKLITGKLLLEEGGTINGDVDMGAAHGAKDQDVKETPKNETE